MKRVVQFAAAASIGLQGVALAQTPLVVGENSGELTVNNEKINNNAYIECFTLDAPKDSSWVITVPSVPGRFDPVLAIGTGDCGAGFKQLMANDDAVLLVDQSSRLSFVSGGGAYSVRVRALGGAAAGPFKVVVQNGAPGKGRQLPPGEASAPIADGSASTVASASPTPVAAGTVFRDCESVCPEMVAVPSGTYLMGSPATEEGRQANEGPRHVVKIERPFAIGKYEVTFAEWDACVADKGCTALPDLGWGRGRRPAVGVTFPQAQKYVAWLSAKTGQKYFIPTEAEWEYAARAKTTTPWNTGDAIITDDANILRQFSQTVPVGGFPPNRFGLHDTHGNVWEWTQDCPDVGYFGAPTNGGAATSGDCKQRAVRGGAWDREPNDVRSARRQGAPVTAKSSNVGLRVARSM